MAGKTSRHVLLQRLRASRKPSQNHEDGLDCESELFRLDREHWQLKFPKWPLEQVGREAQCLTR